MSSTGVTTTGPVNIVKGNHGELVAFLVLNMWPSHLGLPVLLAIVLFSKRVKRHPTFINLIIALMIVGFSSSLLVYAGRTTGPEPSRMLCLLQASLLYGMPAISSTSACMLFLQMFYMIRAAYHGKQYQEMDHMLRLWLMLIAPYVVFFASMLATAIVGASHPEQVSRSRRFFYCSLDCLPITNTITLFSAGVLLVALILIIWTTVMIYKRWKQSLGQGAKARWTSDLSLPIRIICFGFYVIICMSLSLLSVKSPSTPVPDVLISTAATVFLFIFGTQPDILSVLCFWRKPKSRRVTESYKVDLQREYDQESGVSEPKYRSPVTPRPGAF
ncbi:unnamed protein product [Cyclocybe aegerita]|uniref:Uncharacterized protein n=1 Tax=Cyclocybe aegerita TaxID=1973307 RepID=A0A8S0XMB2_CYCAE|nr:unnamed protein product [Cyclocybe aegerita]